MVFSEQAKKVSEGLKALQEELANDPKLATLDKVRKLLKESQSQFDSIQGQIERANRELADRLSESERRSRDIIQDARNEATQLVREAEKVRDDAVKLAREVEASEKAVAYVKTEAQKLDDAKKALTILQREAQAKLVEANVQKDLYVEKVKAMREDELAFVRRDAVIAAKEQELKIAKAKPEVKGAKP